MRPPGEDYPPGRRCGLPIQFLSLVTIVLAINGCMFESSPDEVAGSNLAGNHPPIIRQAELDPTPIVLSGPISVLITTEDQERDTVNYHYQWAVNGSPIAGQTDSTLPPDILKRGDAVSVTVVPDDGKTRGDAYHTKVVSVVNTPPRIVRLSLEPQSIKPGDVVKVQVEANDPDQDRIELSFRWWRNGTVVKEGDEAVLDTTGYSRKDVVTVEATSSDRTAKGKPMKSEPLMLENSPPTITSIPSSPDGRERYEYVVKAIDPEGDHIRYRLETAPPGMTIEADTGHIAWQASPELTGTYKVRVVAEDTQGGTAFQEFDVTLANPIPSKPEGA